MAMLPLALTIFLAMFWGSGYGSVPLSSVQASVSLGIQCLPSSSADSQMLRADAPAPQELSSYACAGSRPSCHHPIKNPLKRNLSESGYLKSRRNLTRGISVPKSIHSPYRALDLLPGILWMRLGSSLCQHWGTVFLAHYKNIRL